MVNKHDLWLTSEYTDTLVRAAIVFGAVFMSMILLLLQLEMEVAQQLAGWQTAAAAHIGQQ